MIYGVIFAIYFLFIIISSIKSSKQVESLSDFTTGGHRMGLKLGVGTTLATWLSVASIMGVPGNLYRTGFAAIYGWVVGWFVATALMPILAYKVRMPAMPTRTFPEFMRLRYEPYEKNSKMQLLIAVLMLIGYFVFAHLQVVGFGIVFSTITGLKYEISIFFFLAVLLFTSFGGFWSVAATDTLNAVLIFVGVVVAAGVVLSNAGGWSNIMSTISTTTAPIYEGGAALESGIMISPFGAFGTSALLSIFLSNALGASVAPHWITRFMAPKNAKAAVLQMTISLLLLTAIFVPLIIIGLGSKVLLPSLPVGNTTDYLFPMIITQYAPPVIGALALVGICAAAVSTANSMLLNCGTSLVYDIKRMIFSTETQTAQDDNKTTSQLRIVIFILGALAVVSAIKPPVLLAMGFTYIYGGFGSAFFWPVWFGLYWKRMNRAGAYLSIIVGLSGYLYATITKMAFPAFLVGAGLSLIACLIGVYATKKPPLEAYEAFFEPDISESTKQVIRHIRKESDTSNEAVS
ncbi:MAG TPA: sodium:solute symporter [Clostridiales bacterium]|jgi:sodium/pantothenate symporter|nr:sodium:solute symporter [Clostridiales bacterium]